MCIRDSSSIELTDCAKLISGAPEAISSARGETESVSFFENEFDIATMYDLFEYIE